MVNIQNDFTRCTPFVEHPLGDGGAVAAGEFQRGIVFTQISGGGFTARDQTRVTEGIDMRTQNPLAPATRTTMHQ